MILSFIAGIALAVVILFNSAMWLRWRDGEAPTREISAWVLSAVVHSAYGAIMLAWLRS